MRRRRAVVAVVALILVGGLAPALLTRARKDRTARSSGDFLQVVGLSLEAQGQTIAELRSASDVLVDREASGTLVVSGRALNTSMRLSSVEELRALLKTLPTPGTAMVYVAYKPTAKGIHGLLESPPPETDVAEQELKAILEEAGFHEPRGNVKSFLPLSPTAENCRPTRR